MSAKRWSSIGILMILLVISIPFYSANVMAATVTISKNGGSAGVDNYLDAAGDNWLVEATIDSPPATVSASDLVLKVGSTENQFNSCSTTALNTVCSITTPLTDGVPAGSYPFTVTYTFIDPVVGESSLTKNAVINADDTAPMISGLTVSQTAQQEVHLDFTVQDSGTPAAGLAEIKIIDADNNAVLQSITVNGETTFNYVADGGSNGILDAAFSGDGVRRIKVSAKDRVGHTTVSTVRSFRTDFVAPAVDAASLEFKTLGRFIGTASITTDITVDVRDSSNLAEVRATSGQAQLQNSLAQCQADADEAGLWHCLWNDIVVNPVETISLDVTAKDSFSNEGSSRVSKTLTKDESAPEINYFGTARQYQGENYVKANADNRIFIFVSEQGAGIERENIEANLRGFGAGERQIPTVCDETSSGLDCYWDVGSPQGGASRIPVTIRKLQDNAGNDNSGREDFFNVDSSGPRVLSIGIFGGEKNYLQSNDPLVIKFTAEEESGLTVLVNLDNLVDSATVNYPEEELTRNLGDGWRVYTEDDGSCSRNDLQQWECTIITEPLLSGSGRSKNLDLRIRDTAGNDATAWPATIDNAQGSDGDYQFTLLGLDTEENPDFWDVRGIKLLGGTTSFVDLDAADLFPSRMAADISLASSEPQASILSMELAGCELAEGQTGPELSRNLMYGGVTAVARNRVTPTVVLEFSPFDGRSVFNIQQDQSFEQATAIYTCNLFIYTKLGTNALATAEIQEVNLEIPFAFSSLGAVDENVGQRVKELKENDFYKFAKALSYVNIALQWVRHIGNAFQVIYSLMNIWTIVEDIVNVNKGEAKDAAKEYPPLEALANALQGSCLELDSSGNALGDILQYIQVPLQILNCDPRGFDEIGLDWLAQYQRSVLDFYNFASGRVFVDPAETLYENMYTSAIGLCVPGIIYNVEKAREIHCRKIVCYGRDVPNGIATIEACNQLYDLQMCQFVLGPIFDFVGLDALGYVARIIKSALSSPIGIIFKVADLATCGVICFVEKPSPGLITSCRVTQGLNELAKIVNSLVSTFKYHPGVTGSPYCKAADQIKVEELTTVETPVEGVAEV